MRRLLSLAAMLLGSVGAIVCVLVVVLIWWAASAAVRRIDGVAARLDERLAQSEGKLTRIQQQVRSASAELTEVRRDAESLIAMNPEPARIGAEFEQLESRFALAQERIRATADSLETLSEFLLAAAEVANEFNPDSKAAEGLRDAAGTLDRANAALEPPKARIRAVAAAGDIQVNQKFLELAGKGIEASDRLAQGLSAARREAIAARSRTAECRDRVHKQVYAAVLVLTLLTIWGLLGQVCLANQGRRWNPTRIPAAP